MSRLTSCFRTSMKMSLRNQLIKVSCFFLKFFFSFFKFPSEVHFLVFRYSPSMHHVAFAIMYPDVCQKLCQRAFQKMLISNDKTLTIFKFLFTLHFCNCPKYLSTENAAPAQYKIEISMEILQKGRILLRTYTIHHVLFTIIAFISLLDNYERRFGLDENVEEFEEFEQYKFLNAILETAVMEKTFQFLQQRDIVKTRCDFRELLEGLWFQTFGRSSKSR